MSTTGSFPYDPMRHAVIRVLNDCPRPDDVERCKEAGLITQAAPGLRWTMTVAGADLLAYRKNGKRAQ